MIKKIKHPLSPIFFSPLWNAQKMIVDGIEEGKCLGEETIESEMNKIEKNE